MHLTRNFTNDLTEIMLALAGPPFALARFCDGEAAILKNIPVPTADRWQVLGKKSWFTKELWRSLCYAEDSYYLGISCACCRPEEHDWYLEHVHTPARRLTFANVFVDGNFSRFNQFVDNKSLIRNCAIVGSSQKCDYYVPANAVNQKWDIDALIDLLRQEHRPILVAAGPASCIIVYRYWTQTNRIASIIDIGSALDPYLHGRVTRGYHGINSTNRQKVCQWSPQRA